MIGRLINVFVDFVDLFCFLSKLLVDEGKQCSVGKQVNSLFVPLDCYLVGCVVEGRGDLATFSGEADEASLFAATLVHVVGSVDESEGDAC